jgi:indole-3-glycerol phosphate synthase
LACGGKDSGLVFAPGVCFVMGVPDKLNEIMEWKRREIAARIRPVTDQELARLDGSLPKPRPFAAALRRDDGRLAVVAEIKRRSPSAGQIVRNASALGQARIYQAAGADALSVLTDERYFGGSLDDLRAVATYMRESPAGLPCLRKDFMVHPIQVLEARESGASAILIIVRALDDGEIRILHGAARAAGLEALFEVHSEGDVERAASHGAELIGVNNRDLAVFQTDLALSERLIPGFPPGSLAVSESGIRTAEDAGRARRAGARAVLVGEALMRSENAAALVASFRAA